MSPEHLGQLADAELAALVAELEERVELFDARLKSYVNDELRRRRMPTLNSRERFGGWRRG